jgi:hypothetical protein
MYPRLQLDIDQSIQNELVRPMKNDNGVKISTQDEESYQLENENIHRRFTSQESPKNQDMMIDLRIGSQITEEIYQKIQISVDKLEFEDQYGEEHEYEEIQEDEVPTSYEEREKQSDLESKKPDGRAPAGNDLCLEHMVIVNIQKETSKATLIGCMEIKN